MRFSANTPYGSKILLMGKIVLENNYLLLDNRNCKFLGGRVDKLVDRIETAAQGRAGGKKFVRAQVASSLFRP